MTGKPVLAILDYLYSPELPRRRALTNPRELGAALGGAHYVIPTDGKAAFFILSNGTKVHLQNDERQDTLGVLAHSDRSTHRKRRG